MDDMYCIPVNSDPKHGLGLLASDLDTLRFPSFCGDFNHEQLLTSEDPLSLYLAYPDTGVFGDEATSRASTAVTPQSECSTRTTLSADNFSPISDITPFLDQPAPQEIESMYHDTTQAIISGRPSRATSATWPSMGPASLRLNSTLSPPVRPVPHRPQSFSYRTHQIPHQENQTPPPPSSFFPSPSLQAQSTPAASPFLSPNVNSPMVPQMAPLPAQNTFLQATMAQTPAYYVQALPPQHLQQQYQQHLQLQQNQAFALSDPLTQQRRASQPQVPSQISGLFQHPLPSQPASLQPFGNSHKVGTSTTPSLANTTGNSSTGYQCFSHGCGGRHFSNWGNLVRHHRERQLRSKAGAKPTCPRCGKGFTRSSARDAHVAGLKCVLGRRRRGGTGPSSTTGVASADAATTGSATSTNGNNDNDKTDQSDSEAGTGEHHDRDDNEQENDNDSEDSREDDAGDADHETDMLGAVQGGHKQYVDHSPEDDSLSLGLSLDGSRPPYLTPQQLQFEH